MSIPPWVKYGYECLIVGFRNSLDIFQQKMDYLFQGFGFIRAYTYNLLIVKKFIGNIAYINITHSKLIKIKVD